MRATQFDEQIQFYGPAGFTAAIDAAALQDLCTRSEFLRRTVVARLREIGVEIAVPLESGKRPEANR
jgi:hypothetical protein